MTGSDPSDLEMRAAMAGQPAGLWLEVFAAADLLDAGASQVQWTETIRSGDGRMSLPQHVYSPAVRSIEAQLYELQVIVPFDWMAWDRARYAGADGLVGAPVADAARLASGELPAWLADQVSAGAEFTQTPPGPDRLHGAGLPLDRRQKCSPSATLCAAPTARVRPPVTHRN